MVDPKKIREDFPILTRRIGNKPLVYLDNAATSQKPEAVLAAMDEFYRQHNANPNRGLHELSEEATGLYEGARAEAAQFIGADPKEIVFTRSATESINLVAQSWGRANLAKGDAIVLTEMEHHANLVPWYLLAEEKGLELRFVEITSNGELDFDDFKKKINGAKLLAVTHLSNVLGTVVDVADLAKIAHKAGARVLVDGAQSVTQLSIEVQALGCDWFVFSAHKMLGPTGIGVLWTKEGRYAEMPPWLGGGEMIKEVELGHVTFNDPPWKFEAGTMPIAEAIGLAAAIRYLSQQSMTEVRAHEQSLTGYALGELSKDKDVTVYGPTDTARRGGLVSFNVAGIHAHDLATILNDEGVAVRSGRHCAHPLHKKLGIPASARASWQLYNIPEDIDTFIKGIAKAKKVLQG